MIMIPTLPYLALIEPSTSYNAVLNLKKQQMSFETDTLCIITTFDPNEEDR